MGSLALGLTMLLAVAAGVGVFVVLPHLLAFWLGQWDVLAYGVESLTFHLVDGVVKVALFVGYIYLISLMKEIKRVFMYHGAEHKTINCLEAGGELTVGSIRAHSRFHPRCGTSFIVIVLIISILVFSFFGRPPYLQRVLLHLALLPAVAGISYEFIRLAGRKNVPRLLSALSLPGVWTQQITTREPDDQQIEVAISSLQQVLASDNAPQVGGQVLELPVP